MKILVVASKGATLGLAQKLVGEGHDVDVFPMRLEISNTGIEIYSIVDNLWKAIQDCKFIIADTGWDKLYDRAKTYNKPIIGAHPMIDVLNSDCAKEYILGKGLGVRYPKTEVFNDLSGLQPKILSGFEKRYYVKVNRKTFICTRPEWLAWTMYNLPANKDILLQEEVRGEKLSIIGWFNGLNWIRPFFYATPDAQAIRAITMLAEKGLNPLIMETIEPFHKWLKVIDYKGPITAHLLVDSKNFYTMRIEIGLSTPAIFAMMEGFKDTQISAFLNSLAFASDNKATVTLDYLMGIEVSNREDDVHGLPILGISEGNLKKIFLQGAYKNKDDFMLSGDIAPIYTAVAHGRDIQEVSRRVYRTIDQVRFPRMYFVTNMQARSDQVFNSLRNWDIL